MNDYNAPFSYQDGLDELRGSRCCRMLDHVDDIPRIGRALDTAHRNRVFLVAARKLERGERLTPAERRLFGSN